jgi:hypothetical protein
LSGDPGAGRPKGWSIFLKASLVIPGLLFYVLDPETVLAYNEMEMEPIPPEMRE